MAVLVLGALLAGSWGCAPVVRGAPVFSKVIQRSFELIVWNDSTREARLRIELDDTVIFDGTVKPPDVDPAIVVSRYAALPIGNYKLLVTDRSTGRTEAVTIRLTRYIHVDVRVETTGMTIEVSTNLVNAYA